MSSRKKIIIAIAVFGLIICSGVFTYIYQKAFTVNTKFSENQVVLFVPSTANYRQVRHLLSDYIESIDKLDFVAHSRKYHKNVKSGRFIIKKGMTSFEMIDALRRNIPIRVKFNNQATIGQLVSSLKNQVEPDSSDLLNSIYDLKRVDSLGVNDHNILALFLPDTYEFYWNTSSKAIVKRFVDEYYKFWNSNRREKAKKIDLTPMQVSILASIVQKESSKTAEHKRIAGVYVNRLKKGMLLQADPTVVYAIKKHTGDFDQVIRRVLIKDTELDSPYNTYKYQGLPPGPITMPDKSVIDAVLNAEAHQYYYFCASIDKLGYHVFAKTLAKHEKNAYKYRQWLSNQGVYR